jgi:hypothetical protein
VFPVVNNCAKIFQKTNKTKNLFGVLDWGVKIGVENELVCKQLECFVELVDNF